MSQTAKSSHIHLWLTRLNQLFSSQPKDRNQLVEVLREAQNGNLFDASALAMDRGCPASF